MSESGEEIEDKMHKFKYDIEKETGIPWKKKKSYRYLYTLACQKGVILRAFKRMKRGKSDRKDIQMVEEDLDGWVEKIQKITIIFIAWLVPIVGPIIILAVLNEDKVIIKYRPGIPLLDYIFLSAVFVQKIGQSDGVIDFGDIGGGGGGDSDGD